MTVDRAPAGLTVTVEDSGVGLPEGFRLDATTSLGLQIVRTLVVSELGGTAGDLAARWWGHRGAGRAPAGNTRLPAGGRGRHQHPRLA